MRLLNTKSLELKFFLEHIPDYVILSHRWMTPASEECTFEDMNKTPITNEDNPARKKLGFPKVQGSCDLARRDGYEWIWIDSCCIDKSSSAELQEAINSMWNYYSQSNICYVYLSDIPDSKDGWEQRFEQSEWFTRGWTLQELIAPTSVEFYSEDWALLCTKLEKHEAITEITKIDPAVLLRAQDINRFSAAEKFSWAAHRNVTRGEDEAYSLLGLFDINMPLLYGEGRQKAFVRLQEMIYNSGSDHSLFLFRYSLYPEDQPLLADSPTRFCERMTCIDCSELNLALPTSISYTNIHPSVRWFTLAHEQILTTVTSLKNEISATLPLLKYHAVSDRLVFHQGMLPSLPPSKITHVAVLNHTLDTNLKGALCLPLCQELSDDVFRRVKSFPALLPVIGKLSSELHTRKILVCPTAPSPNRNDSATTLFSLSGDDFKAKSWNCKGETGKFVIANKGDSHIEFELREMEVESSKRRVEVSCEITDSQDPGAAMLLRIIMIDEAWSIKQVSEFERAKGSRQKHTKFRSDVSVDRCSFRLSCGTRISIGLRRLSAGCRPKDVALTPRYRYQIVVKRL